MIFKSIVLKQMTALLAGCVLFAANASGAVLSSSAPPSSDLGVGLVADAGTGSLPETVALPNNIKINKITFWGFYLDENNDPLATSTSLGYIDAFVIALGGVDVATAGLSKSSYSADLTSYELSFADMDFPVAPTTLDIINNFNDGTDPPEGAARWVWQGIGPSDLDARAYSIEGTQQTVPEPATLALLGLALTGLGLARARKLC